MHDTHVRPVKDALYYPYIHFRNEDWLRSALLFFPHVLRMAPAKYAFRDSDFIRELMETKGAWDQPLVRTYPLDNMEAYNASNRLAERFAADIEDERFVRQFDREAAIKQFGHDGLFQIHHAKFSFNLERVLSRKDLIWESRDRRHGRADWYSVHPAIGEVIMSTAASAAASSHGLDIVTDNGRDHFLAAKHGEDGIYRALLHGDPGNIFSPDVTELEIGDLIISTTFDLSNMTARDFAALSRDQETLHHFSQLLSDEAGKIPMISDPAERLIRAKDAAERIITSWETRRRSWGSYLRGLFKLESLEEAKDVASDMLQSAVTGGLGGIAASGTLLGAAPGLAVGLVVQGAKSWRDAGISEREAPTYFLTKITRHGGIVSAARQKRSEA